MTNTDDPRLEYKRIIVTLLACEHCGSLHEYQPLWNPSPDLPGSLQVTPWRDPHDGHTYVPRHERPAVFTVASSLGLARWFAETFMATRHRQLLVFEGRTGIWEAPHSPAEESQCVALTASKRRCRNPLEYGQTIGSVSWYRSSDETYLVHLAPADMYEQRCRTHRDRPHTPDYTTPEWSLLVPTPEPPALCSYIPEQEARLQ